MARHHIGFRINLIRLNGSLSVLLEVVHGFVYIGLHHDDVVA